MSPAIANRSASEVTKMSRPDPRPTVREEVKVLGDLVEGFDFDQEPRPPLILDPIP